MQSGPLALFLINADKISFTSWIDIEKVVNRALVLYLNDGKILSVTKGIHCSEKYELNNDAFC